MTAYTQKYAALVMAPWLAAPQVQFATFTFDDATSAQFPTWATIREELARRSAFADADATTTGDTWDPATLPKALEVDRLDILYLFEFNNHQALGGVAPPNLAKDTSYVWPAVGTSGLAANLGGLTTFTVAGDNILSGNSSDADDTPPVVASITDAAQTSGGVKAVQEGDAIVAVCNGAEILNAVFVDGSGVDEIAAVDLSGVSSADTYTVEYFLRKANGATSRILSRTHTNT